MFTDAADFNQYMVITVHADSNSSGLVRLTISDKSLVEKLLRGFVIVDQNGHIVPFEYAERVPYFIEFDRSGKPKNFYLKVSSLPVNADVEYYIIPGGDVGPQPSQVFYFVDTFEDGTLDGWQFYGNRGWTTDTRFSAEGRRSAMNQDIGDNQYACMKRNVYLPSSSTIRFYWKVSSETCCDYLRFYIDGRQQAYISGYTGWREVVKPIPAGRHTIAFCYTKDYSVSHGYDTGWVDFIRIYNSDGGCVDLVTHSTEGNMYVVTFHNSCGKIVSNATAWFAPFFQISSEDENFIVIRPFLNGDGSLTIYFDPGYDGNWTEKNFYLLFDTNADVYGLQAKLNTSDVGSYMVSLSAPRELNLYPGSGYVDITPDSTEPGTYTVTAHLVTQNPEAPDYAECEWNIYNTATGKYDLLETNGSLTQSFDYSFLNEGVYTVDYNCYIYMTERISGEVTKTVIVPELNEPYLSLESNLPVVLPSDQNVTFVISVFDQNGAPVQDANVYVTVDNMVTYRSVTGDGGSAYFTMLLGPGDVLRVSVYKPGYHPVEKVYMIERPRPVSGGGAGFVGGGGVGVSPSQPEQPVSQPSVQPASATEVEHGAGMLVAGLAFIILLGVILIKSLHRR